MQLKLATIKIGGFDMQRL